MSKDYCTCKKVLDKSDKPRLPSCLEHSTRKMEHTSILVHQWQLWKSGKHLRRSQRGSFLAGWCSPPAAKSTALCYSCSHLLPRRSQSFTSYTLKGRLKHSLETKDSPCVFSITSEKQKLCFHTNTSEQNNSGIINWPTKKKKKLLKQTRVLLGKSSQIFSLKLVIY